jgi:uncharacterized protein
MNRHLLRSLSLCLLLAVTVRAAPAQAPTDGQPLFLWKVTSPTNTVYLFGSVHAGEKDFYPLPEEVERAFARCKALVLEVDVNRLDQAALRRLLLDKATYPKGQNLWKHLSKETAASLKKYCARTGVPLAEVEWLRPWMVHLALYDVEMRALGLSEEHGVDRHFAARAKKAKLPVVGLETAEWQVNLLAGLSPELQEKLLALTIAGSYTRDTTLKLITAWKTGDVRTTEEEALRAPVEEDPAFKEVIEKIFDERNIAMARRVAGFLQKKREPYFVVVGAGHLVGPRGIPRLLRARGYRVEQVWHVPANEPEATATLSGAPRR